MRILTSFDEANAITAVRLTHSRRFGKVGDLFRLSPHPGIFLWGRLIKRAGFFGQEFVSNLVYIYDAISSERPSQTQLSRTNLIIGPAIVNNLGWVRGYWEIIASEPLAPGDVLRKHLFVKYRGTGSLDDYKLVDETGKEVSKWFVGLGIDHKKLMHSGFSNFNHIDWLVREILETRGVILTDKTS